VRARRSGKEHEWERENGKRKGAKRKNSNIEETNERE